MSKAKLFGGHRRRAWALALATVALLLALGASTAQAVPAGFWGVVPQGGLSSEQYERLHRGGVASVRLPVVWGAIQPAQGGAFDWSSLDPQIEAAARAGIEVLPFFTGAPSWAVPIRGVPGAGGAKAPSHLPVSGIARGSWIAFLKAAVERYGPAGIFWATHPSVPVRPLRTWQIWNEQNFKFFVTRPNPAEYGQLVKLSDGAIDSVDPGAKLLLGGMFARPKESRSKRRPRAVNYFAADFLEQMYKRTPGIRGRFDGVALHPYTYFSGELPSEIEELRRVMSKNRDGGKGLWITELGWSSEPPNRSDLFTKGLSGQARELKGAFSLFERRQARWRLEGVDWFSVNDQPGSCNFCGGTGLFGAGFKPKKAWFEYVRFAGGTP